MKRLAARIAAAALFAATLIGVTPAPADAFDINCAYTRSLSDDPIVFPGQQGASHLHDFFGNRSTQFDSTYASMRAGTTSCQNTADKAGYWVPALYLAGVKFPPKNIKAYYYKRLPNTVAFPPDLRMVAGDSHALGPQSTDRVYFGCGSGTGISKKNYLPNCTSGGNLQIHVLFPYCLLNGVTSYPASRTGPCPSGATVLPQLVERLNYDIRDARTVTLSSGAYFTYHADFWNTWDQDALAKLVAQL